ncbi:MAG: dienelactone hydrolase family protein [Betaproteobacteria bacterium]|nr:dienelactone hydrolase family protein [Pseudomonadota bacterium]
MNDRSDDITSFNNPELDSLITEVKFTRRSFIASSVATGFALAAGPAVAQTAITTPADGLETGGAQIPVAGGNLPTYFAAPKKAGKYATILVIPEIFGMHEYQRDICRRLAKAGYYAITLDPFFRSGDLSKIADIKEVVGKANSLEDKVMLADLDAVVAFLGNQPKANVAKLGITGMCRGGRTVWMYTAHSKKIKAGVSWYGGLNPMPPAMPDTPMDVVDKLNAPVLGLYGGADTGIPQTMVDRLNAGLLAFGKNKESMIHVYPDMPHAFHADYRPSYRKAAADDGWKRMLAWFKKNGVA